MKAGENHHDSATKRSCQLLFFGRFCFPLLFFSAGHVFGAQPVQATPCGAPKPVKSQSCSTRSTCGHAPLGTRNKNVGKKREVVLEKRKGAGFCRPKVITRYFMVFHKEAELDSRTTKRNMLHVQQCFPDSFTALPCPRHSSFREATQGRSSGHVE